MHKLVVTLSALVLAASAGAQEPFQCVNPDVLNSLVFDALPQLKLVARSSLPDVSDGLRAPAEFTLIGSAVREVDSSTVVAYKTALDGSRAFASLVAALSKEGWKPEVTPPLPPALVPPPGPQPLAAMLCRNGERRDVHVQELDGVRYAVISAFETTPRRACGAQSEQLGFLSNPAAMNALRAEMPKLVLPDSAHAVPVPVGGENIGNGTVISTTRIESPDTGATLASYLARQIPAQGWRGDADWKGRLSNGSTWSRSSGDTTYWGSLEILAVGGNTYDVRFTLMTGR